MERLVAGDAVVTPSGQKRRVAWIGYRDVEPQRHRRPHEMLPVRVGANAVAPGMPSRDLLLSPDHALLIDGVLIPVRYLCNGATIRQEACARIRYFHVELDRHDILLAEGLPAESYLDTGNRGGFADPPGITMALAGFAPPSPQPARPVRPVRPVRPAR